ncbi:tyrosine-type recombinase/integrase [Sporomusa sp. KB1]|jgi:site-specific recombinase XerD|uniref:tyrosine-type recombinase/integrase n=1 Tax=Sporomusa sp. KB1 TaxID=943346 RepID=UPI002101FAFB|nr:tyrosine-type recombinase/integrase [Sporomusa sp. KB1]
MKYVEPIRNKQQIDAVKNYLKNRNLRDCLLFVLGINSGLRISDLLSLKISDVKTKDRIVIREKKTGKIKDFPLSNTCEKAINEYLTNINRENGWLFKSKKSEQPITRVQAYRIMNQAAQAVGIKEAIGTHTLRKTLAIGLIKAAQM